MIVNSAIKKDGVIYTGHRHHNIINEQSPFIGFFDDAIQGFVTIDGKFLTRKEAAKYAFENNQINEIINKLYSEDLW